MTPGPAYAGAKSQRIVIVSVLARCEVLIMRQGRKMRDDSNISRNTVHRLRSMMAETGKCRRRAEDVPLPEGLPNLRITYPCKFIRLPLTRRTRQSRLAATYKQETNGRTESACIPTAKSAWSFLLRRMLLRAARCDECKPPRMAC